MVEKRLWVWGFIKDFISAQLTEEEAESQNGEQYAQGAHVCRKSSNCEKGKERDRWMGVILKTSGEEVCLGFDLKDGWKLVMRRGGSRSMRRAGAFAGLSKCPERGKCALWVVSMRAWL